MSLLSSTLVVVLWLLKFWEMPPLRPWRKSKKKTIRYSNRPTTVGMLPELVPKTR